MDKETLISCVDEVVSAGLEGKGETNPSCTEVATSCVEESEGVCEYDITDEDHRYMRIALDLARQAAEIDEVPVGAIVVKDGEIIAAAYNTREHSKCATHHAEVLAIEQACRKLGGWRLVGSTLYVTMEPCAMCAGAIINARLPRVVYGARDIRFGAFGSLIDLAELPLNHKPEIRPDVLGDEAREMLSSYFRKKRGK